MNNQSLDIKVAEIVLRLDRLEENDKERREMLKQMIVLSESIKSIQLSQQQSNVKLDKIDTRVSRMELEPGAKFKQITTYILTAIKIGRAHV